MLDSTLETTLASTRQGYIQDQLAPIGLHVGVAAIGGQWASGLFAALLLGQSSVPMASYYCYSETSNCDRSFCRSAKEYSAMEWVGS